MSPEEVERHINEICWGRKFAFIENEEGEIITIIIKSLSLKDRNFVDFIYKEAIKEARDSGVSTRLEIRNDLKLKELWSEKDDEEIAAGFKKIKVLEDEVKRLPAQSRALRITKNLLASLKRNLVDKRIRRNALFSSSAEEYAEESKSSAIVYCSTYKENEKKYWKNYSKFEKEKDQTFIANIVAKLNNEKVLGIKEIRYIARSPVWRFRWNAGKSHGGLFKDGLLDLDTNQQGLVYWSQVYDSVYEAYERPEDSIIEDDEKLDEWFKSKESERKIEKTIRGDDVDGVKLSNRMSSHGEIFIITNPAMNPDTEYRNTPSIPSNQDVENLNTPFVKKFKEVEQKRIKEHGIIGEKELRSKRDRLARKIIGSNAAVLDKGSLGGRSKGGGKAKRILPGESIG